MIPSAPTWNLISALYVTPAWALQVSVTGLAATSRVGRKELIMVELDIMVSRFVTSSFIVATHCRPALFELRSLIYSCHFMPQ